MAETKKYWFPRKTFGWGWGPPCAWQGWVVLAVYVLAVVLLMTVLRPLHMGAAIAGMAVATAVLLVICWFKGEPPGGWHWGD
jgi:hypothetical protein